ncbi:STAS domain-containing protein [bacterium]|nr:STAS domain-containing protein [candidate division CSSED10-310 bacterium]
MSDFRVVTDIIEKCAIIRSEGYINNLGGEQIADQCYKLIDKGYRCFVLNLGKSKVVNSIGISILIELIERILEAEGKLAFSNLTPTVAKTFRIMGLLQYAETFSEESTAVSALSER